ncbi:hypothetical protein O181_010824 [Austropuccinia psidii MF-1]|uniref:Uncharacterized protein n=1 Tax=Austropuccinia psidii MF-1 TaxID=1389203 RepID=A0A9Q3BTF1_9BASI|nr:hypothetical protein [Austropuccinia psidii MF-1]
MPVEHSPPLYQKISQVRAQAVITPNPRVPLDGIPVVPQLRALFERGPIIEGAAPSRNHYAADDSDYGQSESRFIL